MTEIKAILKILLISLCDIFKVLFHGLRIGRIVNFSNLLKIGFLYAFSVIWVISCEIEYSKHFWSKVIKGDFSEKRFSLYSVRDRIGEGLLYDRMIIIADKAGYDYSAFKFSEELSRFWLTRHFYHVSTSLVNYIFKPKFNLALTHHVTIIPYGYNITYLNMPRDSLFNRYEKFLPVWKHLYNYDAYADLYSFMHKKNRVLEKIAEDKPIIPLYLAQGADEYSGEVPMDKALITGTLWGCNRGSLRISQALKKLADDDLLVGIGLPDYLDFLDEAYLGRMEDFGAAIPAVRHLQQKYGIALIIHNQEHMLDGIPTSRIAEAVSSGALVISDRNGFLLKFFGDNVLYFDAFANNDEIYSQIKTHIEWARTNPNEAHAKTQRAYKIFMDNFTMEKQLESLFAAVK